MLLLTIFGPVVLFLTTPEATGAVAVHLLHWLFRQWVLFVFLIFGWFSSLQFFAVVCFLEQLDLLLLFGDFRLISFCCLSPFFHVS